MQSTYARLFLLVSVCAVAVMLCRVAGRVVVVVHIGARLQRRRNVWHGGRRAVGVADLQQFHGSHLLAQHSGEIDGVDAALAHDDVTIFVYLILSAESLNQQISQKYFLP